MPSPFIAEDYVYLLPHVVDRGTIVHYYTLAGEEDEKELPNKVERALSQYRMKSKVLFFRRVGSYAPRVNRYVTDIEIKDIELQ
jgi:tRNA (guanine37-N1)-methyltransferase